MAKRELPDWEEPVDLVYVLKTFEYIDMPKDESDSKMFYFPKDLEKKICPIELRFYGDRLVVYRECCRIGKKNFQKQYDDIAYATIESIFYRINSNDLMFFANEELIYYRYNEDGSLPDKPFKHKLFPKGVVHINVVDEYKDEMFTVLEQYTGQRIGISDI